MISLFLPRSRARAAWPPAVALLISAACSATAIDPGSLTRDPAPSRLTSPPLAFTQIGMGDGHTCAITATGTAWCWGWNASGQLGDGSETDSPIPVQVNTTQRFTGIAVGGDHACGLTAAGEAWCWGGNFFGEIGDGTNNDRTTPVKVLGGVLFQQLSAGEFLTCAIARTSGAGYCWGALFGSSGEDSLNAQPSAMPAPLPGAMPLSHITAGIGAVCALSSNNSYCLGSEGFLFGANRSSGYNSNDGSTTFVATGGGLQFAEVGLGNFAGCGLTLTGTVDCWGMFLVADDNQVFPTQVPGLTGISQIAVGWSAACALPANGIPLCVGRDFIPGGAGGSFYSYRSATPVGSTAFVQITAGNDGFCGLTAAGAAWCWGQNYWGAVGDGTTALRNVPVPVVGP